MNPPAIPNVCTDARRNIRFTVMAYRTLTEDELLAAVNAFMRSAQGRRAKPGKPITFSVSTGLHDG